MNKSIFTRSLIVLLFLVQIGTCMECYVCNNQGDNKGKCQTTITTCDQGQDMCLSVIRWGTEPYWSQGAKKQYYISKSCADKKTCNKTKEKYMSSCTHLWYQDWACADCCAGDRCNYYVITGVSAVKANLIIIVTGGVLVFTITRFLWKWSCLFSFCVLYLNKTNMI